MNRRSRPRPLRFFSLSPRRCVGFDKRSSVNCDRGPISAERERPSTTLQRWRRPDELTRAPSTTSSGPATCCSRPTGGQPVSPPPPVSRAGRLGKPDRASQQATRAMATSTRLKRAAPGDQRRRSPCGGRGYVASPEQREPVPWPRRSATPREDPGGLRVSRPAATRVWPLTGPAGGGRSGTPSRSPGTRRRRRRSLYDRTASPEPRTRPAPPKLPTKEGSMA